MKRQRGVVALEFVIVSAVALGLLALVIGIIADIFALWSQRTAELSAEIDRLAAIIATLQCGAGG